MIATPVYALNDPLKSRGWALQELSRRMLVYEAFRKVLRKAEAETQLTEKDKLKIQVLKLKTVLLNSARAQG